MALRIDCFSFNVEFIGCFCCALHVINLSLCWNFAISVYLISFRIFNQYLIIITIQQEKNVDFLCFSILTPSVQWQTERILPINKIFLALQTENLHFIQNPISICKKAKKWATKHTICCCFEMQTCAHFWKSI